MAKSAPVLLLGKSHEQELGTASIKSWTRLVTKPQQPDLKLITHSYCTAQSTAVNMVLYDKKVYYSFICSVVRKRKFFFLSTHVQH